MQVKKKIVFSDGIAEIQKTRNEVRLNSGVFLRNKWLNLCIDIASFAAILSRNAKPVKLMDSLAISGG